MSILSPPRAPARSTDGKAVPDLFVGTRGVRLDLRVTEPQCPVVYALRTLVKPCTDGAPTQLRAVCIES